MISAEGYVSAFRALVIGIPALVGAVLAPSSATPLLTLSTGAALSIGFYYGLRWLARFCAPPPLDYWESLTYVAASMMTGCANISMLFVLPALFVVLLLSALAALLAQVRGRPDDAAVFYQRIVGWFQLRRLRPWN